MSKFPSDISVPESVGSWKTKAYGMGVIGGALFGLLAAYLYARAADEGGQHNGGSPSSIPTGTLIGMVLSALALARQIAEAGKRKD